jgi:hypothetical protein
MTDVETGYKAVAFISKKTVAATDPCLGTDVDETNHLANTGPANAQWEKMNGVTSIGLPNDNSAIDIPELGTRIIQRTAGAISISGRIEKWKQDGEWLGAVVGKADYATANVTVYSKGDDLHKYDVVIYTGVPLDVRDALAEKYNVDANETTLEATGGVTSYSEKIKLLNVQLSSYDTTKEPNAGIKETIPYTAEQVEVTRK